MAEKRYTGIAPLRIVVDDITKITPESLDDLECGDLVVKHTIQDVKIYTILTSSLISKQQVFV